MSQYFEGGVSTNGEVAGKTARFEAGVHAEVNFDPFTRLRLASSIQQQWRQRYSQKDGTAIVSETFQLFEAQTAGFLTRARVFIRTRPSNGGSDNYQVTVRILRLRAGALVDMTNTVTITKTNPATNDAGLSLTLDATNFVYLAGDVVMIEIVASGTVGTQGQGLGITVDGRELPE